MIDSPLFSRHSPKDYGAARGAVGVGYIGGKREIEFGTLRRVPGAWPSYYIEQENRKIQVPDNLREEALFMLAGRRSSLSVQLSRVQTCSIQKNHPFRFTTLAEISPRK
ncbi:MAG: hypothetical protein K9G62_05380 [Alphaproteobacteria bacterium]|nr:hypothetical protein [Alphaproteobacteria bacterium]